VDASAFDDVAIFEAPEDPTSIAEAADSCIANTSTKKLCLSERFDVSVTCTAQGTPCIRTR
jgi:hypothetical protein